jgi:hypothetical protein
MEDVYEGWLVGGLVLGKVIMVRRQLSLSVVVSLAATWPGRKLFNLGDSGISHSDLILLRHYLQLQLISIGAVIGLPRTSKRPVRSSEEELVCDGEQQCMSSEQACDNSWWSEVSVKLCRHYDWVKSLNRSNSRQLIGVSQTPPGFIVLLA